MGQTFFSNEVTGAVQGRFGLVAAGIAVVWGFQVVAAPPGCAPRRTAGNFCRGKSGSQWLAVPPSGLLFSGLAGCCFHFGSFAPEFQVFQPRFEKALVPVAFLIDPDRLQFHISSWSSEGIARNLQLDEEVPSSHAPSQKRPEFLEAMGTDWLGCFDPLHTCEPRN